MRAVVQRVRDASVGVAGETVAEIGTGVVVLLGVASGDTVADARPPRGKGRATAGLRERRRPLRPLAARRLRRGARREPVHADRGQQAPEGQLDPTSRSGRPEVAEPLYERFCEALADERRARLARRLRRPDGSRARQRRPGHDRPRHRAMPGSDSDACSPVVGSQSSPRTRGVTRIHWSCARSSRASRWRRSAETARPRRGRGAILPAPHFTGFTKWARRAHFC